MTSELKQIMRLLEDLAHPGQPVIGFEQIVKFIIYAARLKDDILLAQPASYSPNQSQPILPPTIQEFLSDVSTIPLQSISKFWSVLAHVAWNYNMWNSTDSYLSSYQEFGHIRGISK